LDLEVPLIDYVQEVIALSTPSGNIHTTNKSEGGHEIQCYTYQVSALVWAQQEILTGCWPCHANAAKIDAFGVLGFVPLQAASTASCLKHLIA
jgi:hypothetical protein